MSDPAVTNLSPDGLNAQARICLEGSVIVLKQELVDICHSLTLPSASTDSKETACIDEHTTLCNH